MATLQLLVILLVGSNLVFAAAPPYRPCESMKIDERELCDSRDDCSFFMFPKRNFPPNTPASQIKRVGCVQIPITNCSPFWQPQFCQASPINEACHWTGESCILRASMTSKPTQSPTPVPPGCLRYSPAECPAEEGCKVYNNIRSCNFRGEECLTMNYGCRNATEGFCDFVGKYQQKQCGKFADSCMWDNDAKTCIKRYPTMAPTTFPPTPPPTCTTIADKDTCFLEPNCRWYAYNACNVDGKNCVPVDYGCQSHGFCSFTQGKYPKIQCNRFGHCAWDDNLLQCHYTPPTVAPTHKPTQYPTTLAPTKPPTRNPTKAPTLAPTRSPTRKPTNAPTRSPTGTPTRSPTTSSPTNSPTRSPTLSPTARPTHSPSVSPSASPTATDCTYALDKEACSRFAGEDGRCEWIAPRVCNNNNCKTFNYGCRQRGFCDMSQPGLPRAQCASRAEHCVWNATESQCVSPCAHAPPIGPFYREMCPTIQLTSDLPGTKVIRFAGTNALDQAGREAVGDGDIDGDGKIDFVVASPNALRHQEGRDGTGWVNIIMGSLGISQRSARKQTVIDNEHIRINGTYPEGLFGEAMVLMDLDGDSYSDLIVAAPYADALGRVRAGQVYIIWGRKDFQEAWQNGMYANIETAPADYVSRIPGPTQLMSFGSDISRAGYFDNDKFQDLIICARDAGPQDRGRSGECYIIYGQSRALFKATNELSSLRHTRIIGPDPLAFMGTSVSGGMDVNNDGFGDVIIGEPWGGDERGTGVAWVVFGRAQPGQVIDLAKDNWMLDSNQWNYLQLIGEPKAIGWGTFGNAVAMVGDVNVDGIDDFVVGAPFYDSTTGGFESGRVYVYYGRKDPVRTMAASDLMGNTGGFIIDGIAAGDRLGSSLASGFLDFNGDGYADILIGSPTRNTQVSLGGQATVIFGSCSLFPRKVPLNKGWAKANIGTRINGARNEENLGYSVAVAGDVDKDGRTDLLIGGHFSERQRGAVYLVKSC